MSELYLDTDDLPFDDVARICAESKFSLSELEAILFEEVHPVLSPNLSGFGFVWTGFDQEWLCERIQSARRPVKFGGVRLHKWLRSRTYPWRDLRKKIVERREARERV